MAFAYYKRLTRRQQGIYRMSNEIPTVRLLNPRILQAITWQLDETLPGGDRHATQTLCTELLNHMAQRQMCD